MPAPDLIGSCISAARHYSCSQLLSVGTGTPGCPSTPNLNHLTLGSSKTIRSLTARVCRFYVERIRRSKDYYKDASKMREHIQTLHLRPQSLSPPPQNLGPPASAWSASISKTGRCTASHALRPPRGAGEAVNHPHAVLPRRRLTRPPSTLLSRVPQPPLRRSSRDCTRL